LQNISGRGGFPDNTGWVTADTQNEMKLIDNYKGIRGTE
jgi:hypothetical protein